MPRTWTKEQKEAAASRMKLVAEKRWAKQREVESSVALLTPQEVQAELNQARSVNVDEINRKLRDPEVQSVIDSMDPKRKAKLAGVQNRIWQDNGRADGKEAQEALARFEQAKRENPVLQEIAPLVPQNTIDPDAFKAMAMQSAPSRDQGRIGSREVSLIVRTDGTMVSQYGPCVCGRAKREWHAICCKP